MPGDEAWQNRTSPACKQKSMNRIEGCRRGGPPGEPPGTRLRGPRTHGGAKIHHSSAGRGWVRARVGAWLAAAGCCTGSRRLVYRLAAAGAETFRCMHLRAGACHSALATAPCSRLASAAKPQQGLQGWRHGAHSSSRPGHVSHSALMQTKSASPALTQGAAWPADALAPARNRPAPRTAKPLHAEGNGLAPHWEALTICILKPLYIAASETLDLEPPRVGRRYKPVQADVADFDCSETRP